VWGLCHCGWREVASVMGEKIFTRDQLCFGVGNELVLLGRGVNYVVR
jgi:hypothetical protein